MYQVLTLIVTLYAVVAMADMPDEACLSVHKLTQNQLTFFYTQKDKADKPYFYVKALLGHDAPRTTETLGNGGNLIYVLNTKPHIYQIPEKTQKLYILKAKGKLEGFDPLAQVVPEYDTENRPQLLTARIKRNVTNYLQALPVETKQRASSEDVIAVCEVAL